MIIRHVARRWLHLTIGCSPLSTHEKPSIFRRIKDDIDEDESHGILPSFGPKPTLANWVATSTLRDWNIRSNRTQGQAFKDANYEEGMAHTEDTGQRYIQDHTILCAIVGPHHSSLRGQLRRQREAHIQSVRDALPDLRKAYELLEHLKVQPFANEDEDEDEDSVESVKVDDEEDFWFHCSRHLAICRLYGLPALQSIPVPPLSIESCMEFLEEEDDDVWLVKDGLDGLGPETVNEHGLQTLSEAEAAPLLRWWLGHVTTGTHDQRLKAVRTFSVFYKRTQDGD